MLTGKERDHIEHFLEDFQSADLYALAFSISQRNLSPTSREDALNIICQHSECIESILEKRKITKNYLCQYLHRSKVSITFSWDKPALIRKILEFWNIKRSESHVSENAAETIPATSTHQSTQDIREALKPVNPTSEYYKELSYKFAEWFYSLMNDQDLSKIGPEHFFADSHVKLVVHSEHDTDTIEMHSSTDVSQILRDFQLTNRLQFLPNLMPGAIRYECDIHGQVMLMANGTLHSNVNQVVGVFEQIFLLIRDISDHKNWKIKKSQVILRRINSAIQSSPSSEDALPVCP